MLTRYGGDANGSKRSLYVVTSTSSGGIRVNTLKISRKNWNPEKLYKAILDLIEIYKKKPKISQYVSVESVAYELRAKEKDVKKIFMRLNTEGILTQKLRSFAHDTNRNNFFYGSESGWMSNVYGIKEAKLTAL